MTETQIQTALERYRKLRTLAFSLEGQLRILAISLEGQADLARQQADLVTKAARAADELLSHFDPGE